MARPNNPAVSGLKRRSKGMTGFVVFLNPSKRISKYLKSAHVLFLLHPSYSIHYSLIIIPDSCQIYRYINYK